MTTVLRPDQEAAIRTADDSLDRLRLVLDRTRAATAELSRLLASASQEAEDDERPNG